MPPLSPLSPVVLDRLLAFVREHKRTHRWGLLPADIVNGLQLVDPPVWLRTSDVREGLRRLAEAGKMSEEEVEGIVGKSVRELTRKNTGTIEEHPQWKIN